MENIKFEHQKDKGFVLTEFPNADKVIEVESEKAKLLCSIALTIADLKTSRFLIAEFLKSENFENKNFFWRMALIYYYKAYKGNQGKLRAFCLSIDRVLGEDEQGKKAHKFFTDLRDKDIAHDDGLLNVCKSGAIINKLGLAPKIEKIVCLISGGEFNDYSEINNLLLLIEKSLVYTEEHFDDIANEITKELDNVDHKELLNRGELSWEKPSLRHPYFD